MTRFVYIADTHLGADPMGYQMQPGHPERLPEIVAALTDWIVADGRIDFILHGGDLVDVSTDTNIRRAADLFDLPVPMHLCLGNHDTTEPGAAERWLALAPQLFGASPGNAADSPTYTVDADDCIIHVLPNHWCETDHYWQEALDPQLRPAQVEHILTEATRRPDTCHILLTHSPAVGVPTEQSGLDHVFHQPPAPFTAQLADLAARCNIDLILGAHSHVNMFSRCNGARAATISALAETPFEFKLIEADSHSLNMRTVSLADRLPFHPATNPDNAWTHGRPIDRAF